MAPRPTGRVTGRRRLLQVIWVVHRAMFRVSRGRVGTQRSRPERAGTLFLRTTGRRTGQPRINGLYYLADGERLAVVASNVGSEEDPAWWRNLEARPEAEILIGREERQVRARRATKEEAEGLWPRLTRAYPDWGRYRETTERAIPVVILEPR